MDIHTNTYIYIHTHSHSDTYIRMYVHRYIHIHTYINHTYINTYTYILPTLILLHLEVSVLWEILIYIFVIKKLGIALCTVGNVMNGLYIHI